MASDSSTDTILATLGIDSKEQHDEAINYSESSKSRKRPPRSCLCELVQSKHAGQCRIAENVNGKKHPMYGSRIDLPKPTHIHAGVNRRARWLAHLHISENQLEGLSPSAQKICYTHFPPESFRTKNKRPRLKFHTFIPDGPTPDPADRIQVKVQGGRGKTQKAFLVVPNAVFTQDSIVGAVPTLRAPALGQIETEQSVDSPINSSNTPLLEPTSTLIACDEVQLLREQNALLKAELVTLRSQYVHKSELDNLQAQFESRIQQLDFTLSEKVTALQTQLAAHSQKPLQVTPVSRLLPETSPSAVSSPDTVPCSKRLRSAALGT